MPKDEFRTLLVRGTHSVADNVLAIRLCDPSGSPLPAWQPGTHVPVQLPSGVVRQYSLCGPLDQPDEWTIAVLRQEAGRGGSREVHDIAAPGREILVGPPRNNFRLLPSDRYIFAAGGIGITPILAMCREASSRAIPWTLYYGGRSRASMAFTDILANLPGGDVHLVPQDECGFLDLAKIVADAGEVGRVYCCGPEGLLDALSGLTALAGVDLRLERFSLAQEAMAGVNRAFRVRVQGRDDAWDVAEDRTILQALLAAGLDPLFSCEEGTCGTCETRVLAGTPDHRDSVLTEAERAAGDKMMICVSRARSEELVLDVDG